MKKAILAIAFAGFMLVGIASAFVYTNTGSNCEVATACGRCGDGKCVKQCGENAKTCPKDCGIAFAK